ncbi:hypothetical protein A2303_06375 [Candidatus Falkowbacteria bacterium RIFOXYB2_FULL_47_14]|uniref:Type II secretion system protein GspG C-terminal domain-containing protein n=1 Tax=Candidatus Falkowbacteria bacterium RIFOXYA2_FULL_47_19 TaxID=1797994 RepID=A0A1F5SJM3_9BACT|nr:MAG: hypothetical protein A2227_06445 [Candidatus Falkowbacteria bacterium RIFOXYA2_FULL_47_19]OGF35728.1 MAG: hypothetical protein A2468_05120 [Candidatus Falkowbacteria bacterium RIFOXYC2_FULL_46_15]OGF43967.1 MAG: hypothetical protein A2303_06375 [Candidatus Falkowbacteria bacterium RIFOXYB2_FULL_47_14]
MRNNKGFTLIELLVVIAIIGLLSSLAVVSLNNARQKARDARIKSDLKQVSTALELAYSEDEEYPVGDGACGGGSGRIMVPNLIATADPMCCGNGNPIISLTGESVLQALPCHPVTGSSYYFEGTAAGDSYCIAGELYDGTYFACSNGSCFDNGANNCTEL